MPQYRIWDTPILKKTHELYSLFQIFLGENIATGIPTDYNVDEDIDDYQALFYNTDVNGGHCLSLIDVLPSKYILTVTPAIRINRNEVRSIAR
jgi:hypothetical protein